MLNRANSKMQGLSSSINVRCNFRHVVQVYFLTFFPLLYGWLGMQKMLTTCRIIKQRRRVQTLGGNKMSGLVLFLLYWNKIAVIGWFSSLPHSLTPGDPLAANTAISTQATVNYFPTQIGFLPTRQTQLCCTRLMLHLVHFDSLGSTLLMIICLAGKIEFLSSFYEDLCLFCQLTFGHCQLTPVKLVTVGYITFLLFCCHSFHQSQLSMVDS